MTSEAVINRRNLESEMLFLRQEHAKTLKGLHEEIKVLQKRCTELTFKLTMQGLHTEDTSELEAKVKKLLCELDSAKSNEGHLLEAIGKERNKIKELEIQLKYQAIKHNQEVALKDKEVNSLRADLDYKADYIGHLSTELHKTKIQQKLEENLNMKSKENNVYHVVPAPPKNAPGSAGGGGRHSRRSHMQKSRSDDVELNEAWHSPTPSSGRSSASLRNHGSRLNSPHHPPGGMSGGGQANMSCPSSQQDLSELSPSSSSASPFLNRDHHHHHHHHHHRRHMGSGGGGGGNNNNNTSSSSHNGNNNNNNNMCSSSSMSPSSSSSVLIKSKPAPRLLPPIRQNGGQIQSQNLRHVYVKNVVRPHCFRAQPCECNAPQVETLAVEQIGRIDSGWRNAHHPKSTEYK